jgi:MinD superfamily P-loop ATPase
MRLFGMEKMADGMKTECQELVVISGKGGTGKTSVAASFAVLATGRAVIADCDVDAADMHLVLEPKIIESIDFKSGREAVIRREKCTGCGLCAELCRFGSIRSLKRPIGAKPVCAVDPVACEGCGVCVRFCPADAVAFPERLCGEWMVSETRCGPMVHACLGAAAENSGKLVSTVRREARRIAEEKGLPLIVTDGPPGIGCPVIASITGASQVLAVTEPTVSGEHDLERVLKLALFFEIPTSVCVNKWDINPEMTERIEKKAEATGARVVGRIRYDRAVTAAQIQAKAVVETDAPSAEDIRSLWKKVWLDHETMEKQNAQR